MSAVKAAIQTMSTHVAMAKEAPQQALAKMRANPETPAETIGDLEQRCACLEAWATSAQAVLTDLEQHPRQWLAAQSFWLTFAKDLKRQRPVRRGSYGGGGKRQQARQQGEY